MAIGWNSIAMKSWILEKWKPSSKPPEQTIQVQQLQQRITNLQAEIALLKEKLIKSNVEIRNSRLERLKMVRKHQSEIAHLKSYYSTMMESRQQTFEEQKAKLLEDLNSRTNEVSLSEQAILELREKLSSEHSRVAIAQQESKQVSNVQCID